MTNAEALTLILTIASPVAIGAVALKMYRDRRDRKSIYQFMCSDTGIEYDFRSKGRIASETGLTPERVVILCGQLCAKGKLRRNQLEKDSWRLS